ncbi:diguanylate cyclase [Anaerobacillus sp. CMMVII]|uniref:sensor domain-containing diguanylate cyclase n=1 Tax=Anaerobacillus sp. CMMVII TaxID=2755588 RepID=UPI0021B6FF30|nr:cache domain-containing protein [Anaerobacillus sp. CMMVII]MCT8139149.1 diguanylate cyclase [Anaerobacillus sp. CMMVII]
MKKRLQFWLLILSLTAVFGILFSTLFASYLVTKDTIIQNTLNVNEVYSHKLAQITDDSFKAMELNLEARSVDFIPGVDSREDLLSRLDRMINSSKYFNLLAVIDKEGILQAVSPRTEFLGQRLDTLGVIEALEKKRPLISEPYIASTGHMTVLISVPLWGDSGEYLGFLGGTIFLHEDNIVKTTLGDHFSNDGSYVYVVDRGGKLIYHPEASRIGEKVNENVVVEKVLSGINGRQRVTNTKGVDMLAGYSYVPTSGWGIVSQTPYNSIENPLQEKIGLIILYTLPFLFEFVILMPNTKGEEALIAAERLRNVVQSTPCLKEEYITISLGVGSYKRGEGLEEFFNRVDAALYRGKNEGRNRSILAN